MHPLSLLFFFFFFNDTATTEIYTLSLHDALPISGPENLQADEPDRRRDSVAILVELAKCGVAVDGEVHLHRSEEHTSELQSRPHLVCRLLLEKKKKTESTDSLTELCSSVDSARCL